jgi:hypothetical protein
MLGIKNLIPNPEALIRLLEMHNADLLKKITPALSAEIVSHNKSIAYQSRALFIGLGPGVILLLALLGRGFTPVTILASTLLILVLGYLLHQSNKFKNHGAKKFDELVHEHILGLFQLEKIFQHEQSSVGLNLLYHLNNSNIIHTGSRVVKFDDYIKSNHPLLPCIIGEVQIDNEYKKSPLRYLVVFFNRLFNPAKHQINDAFFRGYFMYLTLPTSISNKIFVTTKVDGTKYGTRNFVESIFLQKSREWTELEWNDFNSIFDVVGANQREIREVLTPDLMVDLFEWSQTCVRAVRIVYCKDNFYVLLPHREITFGRKKIVLDQKTILQNTRDIALPLWFLLVLAEDVHSASE